MVDMKKKKKQDRIYNLRERKNFQAFPWTDKNILVTRVERFGTAKTIYSLRNSKPLVALSWFYSIMAK